MRGGDDLRARAEEFRAEARKRLAAIHQLKGQLAFARESLAILKELGDREGIRRARKAIANINAAIKVHRQDRKQIYLSARRLLNAAGVQYNEWEQYRRWLKRNKAQEVEFRFSLATFDTAAFNAKWEQFQADHKPRVNRCYTQGKQDMVIVIGSTNPHDLVEAKLVFG